MVLSGALWFVVVDKWAGLCGDLLYSLKHKTNDRLLDK